MYKNLLPLLFVLLLSFSKTSNAQDSGPNMGIIPAPVSLQKQAGTFTLSQQTVFVADSPGSSSIFSRLSAQQKNAEYSAKS